MIHIDPKTHQRVTYQPNCGDIQYDLIGGSAISTEVEPIRGPTRNQQMNQGRSNALFGTDAAIKGAKLPNIGITGENTQTTIRDRISRRIEV